MPISTAHLNVIGLGVAAMFAGLSVVSVASPRTVDDLFGVTRESRLSTAEAPRASAAATRTVDYTTIGTLICGRDLTIAVAIYCLGRAGRSKEMGTVILSTLCVTIADIWLAWRNKRYLETLAASFVAVAVAIIGVKLRK
ncbi:hypothetical protein LLEC1_07111 [Akanthomyces lecanii]|uniref:Uncharacterized protein n=1 Tax=Cordyceps confragosa TaxID=2714763 RepID=A0A179ITS9_CORDF|nr:hypothetical protein LLEC1_07111 [Akanthomyces lecanii]